MFKVLIGVFIVLHGLVHLLYYALSRRLVELDTPIAGWPERSWLLSNHFAESTTRSLASVLYLAATVIFVIGGVGVLARASWGNVLLVTAAIFSSAIILIFWDGKFQQLPDKGFVGILINILVVAALYLLERSDAVA